MAKTEPRPLIEYVRAKKLKDCPVCQLPDMIRSQVAAHRSKKIPRTEVVEWLTQECGQKITVADLVAHCNARHEAA